MKRDHSSSPARAPGRTRWLASSALALGLWRAVTAAPASTPATDLPPLQVPASYLGTYACPGCAETPAQLDLWADGTFHLRRAGALDDPARADQVGRWRRDPAAAEILLEGGHEAPLRLQILDASTLRGLDALGSTVAGSGVRLVTDGQLRPASLELRLHGSVQLAGDTARFEECLSGRSYDIAAEQDAAALLREVRSLPAAQGAVPVLASFDGAIVQPSDTSAPVVIVRRLAGLWPGQSCERAMSHASLSNQYWRLGRLPGEAAGPVVAERETYLILRGAPGGYVVNAGCGRFAGQYRVEARQIEFDAPASPLPACPPALQARQQQFAAILQDARHWAIQGQVLELFAADRRPLAAFEAVYLR